MDDNIKIEKQYLQLQETRSKRKKYTNTFCVLKYNSYICLQHIEPGSYPTDRGSVCCTKSIRDIIEHKG